MLSLTLNKQNRGICFANQLQSLEISNKVSNSMDVRVITCTVETERGRERERRRLRNRCRKERIREYKRKPTTFIPFHHKMAEYKLSQLYFFPVAPANLSVICLPHIHSHSYASHSEPSSNLSPLACFPAVTTSCTLHTVDLTCYTSHVGNFDDVIY